MKWPPPTRMTGSCRKDSVHSTRWRRDKPPPHYPVEHRTCSRIAVARGRVVPEVLGARPCPSPDHSAGPGAIIVSPNNRTLPRAYIYTCTCIRIGISYTPEGRCGGSETNKGRESIRDRRRLDNSPGRDCGGRRCRFCLKEVSRAVGGVRMAGSACRGIIRACGRARLSLVSTNYPLRTACG